MKSENNRIDRRELLKKSCGLGVCSCLAMAWPGAVSAEEAPAKPKLQDWQIDFMRARLEDLLDIIATTLNEPTRAKVLGRLGHQCGKRVVKGFEGNPEGFWAHIKTQWLDHVEYDKEKGVIHHVEKERTDCNCPLAAMMKVPRNLCLCSLGAQETIYGSLFNREAKAKLDGTVLQGAKRCAFTINLQPESHL